MTINSVWPIDRTLSGAIFPGQRGSAIVSNEGVLSIPQSSSISWASPSDFLLHKWDGLSFSNNYYYNMWFFLHQLKLMVFHRILSDSKSYHVFRTLLSILADLNKYCSNKRVFVFRYPTLPTPCDLFTLALVCGLWLEAKQKKVSPSLLDTSQYSGRS